MSESSSSANQLSDIEFPYGKTAEDLPRCESPDCDWIGDLVRSPAWGGAIFCPDHQGDCDTVRKDRSKYREMQEAEA